MTTVGRVVAIDGPAASGKSTVARRVAQALGFLYADSGAVYRTVTWQALRTGVAPRDAEAVTRLAETLPASLDVAGGQVRFLVDGCDPGLALRAEEINRNVSPVAATSAVRTVVVTWLRRMAGFGDLVMEGRDIGTVVFPATPWKFYLDASPEERARRRHLEMAARAESEGVDAVGRSLQQRDRIDSSRPTAPLRVAEGAVVVDSTGLDVEAVVAQVLQHIRL